MLYEEFIKQEEPPEKASSTLSQLTTALIRYTLPGWGAPSPAGNKLTQEEITTSQNFMKEITVEQLGDAVRIQQAYFDEAGVPGNTQYTYRSVLRSFLKWCQLQEWGKQIKIQPLPRRQRKRSNSAFDVRLTNRSYKDTNGELSYKYSLGSRAGEEIPPRLKAELNEFYQFRTVASELTTDAPVKPATAQNNLKHIRSLLGWLHRTRRVPLEELSLTSIVSVPSTQYKADADKFSDEAQAIADYTVKLATDYIEWLRTPLQGGETEVGGRGIQSPYTEVAVLQTIVLVAKFIYRQEANPPHKDREGNIPVIRVLREQLRLASERAKHYSSIKEQSKEVISWSEVWQFLEALQQECTSHRVHLGQTKNTVTLGSARRSITAIAQSYQRFILAGLIASNPLRQHIFRHLFFRRSPIDLEQLEGKTTQDNNSYLYEFDGVWWLSVPLKQQRVALSDSKPKNNVSRNPNLRVVNWEFSDGSYFYQYLEEWLIEYIYLNKEEDIIKRAPLRDALEPRHSFVFTKKNGYSFTNSTEFASLLRNASMRLIGKILTPEDIRESVKERNSYKEEIKHKDDNKFDDEDKVSEELRIGNLIELPPVAWGNLPDEDSYEEVYSDTPSSFSSTSNKGKSNTRKSNKRKNEELRNNDIGNLVTNLKPTSKTYPVVINAQSLEGETDESEIAQELCTQIYLATNAGVPPVDINSAIKLKPRILRIKADLEYQNLVIVLYGCDPNEQMTEFFRRRLLPGLDKILHIAWITKKELSSPFSSFQPDGAYILKTLQNWIDET